MKSCTHGRPEEAVLLGQEPQGAETTTFGAVAFVRIAAPTFDERP